MSSILPGANECDDDWHRLKHVAVDRCPTCGMTLAQFNALLREAGLI